MTPQIFPDAEALAFAAADWLLDRIARKPDLLLCLPTGASPTRLYARLADARAAGRVDFSRVQALKLDEWAGLAMTDPATCEVYLQRHILRPLGIPAQHYAGFRSDATDLAAECGRIEKWLQQNGPIDVCILGLGSNGHLGLNEPDDALHGEPHVATLTPSTLRHPMLGAAARAPTAGLTLGMSALLQSREILLLVSGTEKADILARTLQSGITPALPASFLHLHPRVTCLCDQAAGQRR